MNEEEIKPDNQENNRNPDGTFKKGISGNPEGRPRGQSLKEYDRDKFSKMTPEEKEGFLKTISAELRYKMAEGNPTNEITGGLDIKVSKLESIELDTKNILNGQDKEIGKEPV